MLRDSGQRPGRQEREFASGRELLAFVLVFVVPPFVLLDALILSSRGAPRLAGK